ncbi:MAG TPA: aldose 1-epimerase [Casimicrobiaceae bacterium]|jgi:aldose 1-epimerase
MTDTLALSSGEARLEVAPAVGGAIARFTWQDRPVMRPASSEALGAGDVRACACYPLVPYSNRIRDATLRFEGRTYALARNFGSHPHSIHGVGWQRPWQVRARSAEAVQLALAHEASRNPAGWPWSFEAWHTMRLSTRDGGGVTLSATLCIASRSDTPFPFGLGWHPFFPKDADTMLRFGARGMWRNDATQLPVALEPVASDPGTERLRGRVLDNLFTGWDGCARLTSGARDVMSEADRACAYVVVYAPEGRGFVAIEPVTHETDAFNRAADGEHGTGMRVLGPGESFSCTMRLTLAP